MPRYAWAEVDATAEAIEQAMMAQTHIRVDGEWVAYTPTRQELLDKAAKNRERSAKRAKTKVRRLVKAKNLDTMLTLTYRENMTDRSRMARDFDVFVKRLRRALPSFSTSASLSGKSGALGTRTWPCSGCKATTL